MNFPLTGFKVVHHCLKIVTLRQSRSFNTAYHVVDRLNCGQSLINIRLKTAWPVNGLMTSCVIRHRTKVVAKILSCHAVGPHSAASRGHLHQVSSPPDADCANADKGNIKEPVEAGDFRMIYKFPYILHARTVCRLKLFQTGVALISASVSAILAFLDVIEVQYLQSTIFVALVASAMVYVMGGFFRSLVGIMYVNEKRDILKVAHLTFWGGRRDIQMQVADVVPFGDRNERPNNIYFTLRRYSAPKEKLYYVIRFGGVLDREAFVSILGEHS